MSKRAKPSPVPTPTHNGRPLVLWGEPYPAPKWDLYIAALLAYSLRAVQRPEQPEPDRD
jgi:hypothetical protein